MVWRLYRMCLPFSGGRQSHALLCGTQSCSGTPSTWTELQSKPVGQMAPEFSGCTLTAGLSHFLKSQLPPVGSLLASNPPIPGMSSSVSNETMLFPCASSLS